MPNYNSNDGVWEPAKEKVALEDKKGEPYVYEGPDRGALKYMQDQGVSELGRNFRQDPEIIMRAHQLHMTVDEFCQVNMHPDEKRKAQFEENSKKVTLHKSPERKSFSKDPNTGGKNTAGSGSLYGGFGSDGSDVVGDALKSVKS